jgi:fructose-1,6-bisphosphatase/inositol monophosphatase family enzyme
VQAAWILLPIRQEMWVAEASSGTFRNGVAVKVQAAGGPEHPHRGSVSARFMPNGVGDAALRATAGRYLELPKSSCAVEYTEITAGRREFAVYYRLLPWDHAAPALILREGGGRVDHLDGRPYGLRSANEVTVVARDEHVSAEVRGWLRHVPRR